MPVVSEILRYARNPLPPVYHGPVARGFHWLAVLSVVAAFATAFFDRLVPESRDAALSAHRTIGVALLALTTLRFFWRSQYQMPPAGRNLPRTMRGLSSAVQAVLYGSLFMLPVLGWAYTNARGRDVVLFDWITLPRLMPRDRIFADEAQAWHHGLAMIFAAVIAVHVGGALYHHFVRRDGLLLAMLPRRRHPRFSFRGDCEVEWEGGVRVRCPLFNISAGGARLQGGIGCSPEQRGTLRIDGLAFAPSFLVIETTPATLRIGFTLDHHGQSRFDEALAEFAARDPRIGHIEVI